MTTFNTHDAFLLTELAQYPNLSDERKRSLLEALSSEQAKQTAQFILDPTSQVSEEVRSAATAFLDWAQANRASARNRGAVARRTQFRRRLARVG